MSFKRAASGIAVSTGLLAAALLLLTIGQAGRILPGVEVLGVDVGGQDRWEARRNLLPVLQAVERRPLGVSAPGSRLDVRRSDAGLRLDLEATVEAALEHGRRGPFAPLRRMTTPILGARVLPHASVDDAALAAWIEIASARVEREEQAGDLEIDEALRTVHVQGPHGAIAIDRTASADALRAALLDPSAKRAELVSSTSLPPTDRTGIEELARAVTRALRTGLELDHEGRRLRITPQDVADLITVRTVVDAGAVAPELHVPVDHLRPSLIASARRTFDRSPGPAVLIVGEPSLVFDDRSSTSFRPVPLEASVTPSIDRTVVVPRRLARQLERMIVERTTRATADLLVIEPDLTTAAAEERLPTHVLGTFTTRFTAGGDRTVNIALLAAILDGTLIAPGAEFSVNRTSGPRSCSAGFLEAGTIVRGELVDTCGGGVSQVGTTVLNAAFFAGLPLTAWQPHSFFISRYPAGREATLSYPQLDVRFVNDTGGWIVLRAATTPTSVTVSLLGRPRWAEVRATHGPWSPPTPFTEVVRIAPDVAPGTRRLVQSGGEGFSVTVSRTRIPLDGRAAPDEERWRTVYRPQQRIVEISPVDAPVAAAPPAAADAGSAD